MATPEESWYIVKRPSNQCEILAEQDLIAQEQLSSASDPLEKWGPFKAKNQALAKRVGLIRAGKCQPS